MQDWVEQELGAANLGDKRLDRRFRMLTDCLSLRPSVSLPVACGGTTELTAAYRFFGNERVTFASVFAPHQQATLERIRAQFGDAVAEIVMGCTDSTETDPTKKDA